MAKATEGRIWKEEIEEVTATALKVGGKTVFKTTKKVIDKI
jgi:hypothetical protein